MWRSAQASAVGSSHALRQEECQDSSACRIVGDAVLAVVADGAGSAARAWQGSSIAVGHFVMYFSNRLNTALTHDDFVHWLTDYRELIQTVADETGAKPIDFSCTFAGAILTPDQSVFVQIGDGGIIVAPNLTGPYEAVFWPQHGEFANSTNFITGNNAVDVMMFAKWEQHVHGVALFTDGVERLLLDFGDKTAFTPSLRPIFEWLDTAEGDTDAVIERYLASRHIQQRTDDDTTLVMAIRQCPL